MTHEPATRRRPITLRAGAALFAAALATGGAARAQQRPESREQWYRDGQRTVDEAARLRPINTRAKNVILFIGDGMGISTITAARILEGQLRGGTGEENSLSFERLPYVALSKTYSVNQQTPDSAPTMTAIITGVKTEDAMLSVGQGAVLGDHTTVPGNELPTLLEIAERAGLSTGVVTTATVTHATPGACYAHTPHRGWENDSNLSPAAKAAGFPDIARQLIEFPHGDGLEVALGGGRAHFLPSAVADPEDAGATGNRTDGRDLTKEWTAKRARSTYVWNKAQFDAVDPARTDHLLGLFEQSQMEFEADRATDAAKEPSLTEMTAKAIDLLSRNRRGYFLMVEGGRIDHAHHGGNAYRALTDTVELSNAVRAAMSKVDMRETLIVVTADHSHVFTIAGYPTRGNPIFGKVRGNDSAGNPEPAGSYDKDATGLPYTTLGYANGPGYRVPEATGGKGGRPNLTNVDTAHPDYKQEAAIPMGAETHGGEDVAVFAGGPGAHLIRGVIEQNVIFHVMLRALGLDAAPARRGARRARR